MGGACSASAPGQSRHPEGAESWAEGEGGIVGAWKSGGRLVDSWLQGGVGD